jgi:hypothetical protein
MVTGVQTCALPISIGRNAKLIQGDAADLVVDTEGAAFELVFHSDTYGWRIFTV